MGQIFSEAIPLMGKSFKVKTLNGHNLELVIKGSKLRLPRFRRSPNSSTWRTMFLVMNFETGIQDGAYSDIDIFESDNSKDGWSSILEVEAWKAYDEIKTIEFVQKDKTSIILDHRNEKGEITINPKNRVVKIIINGK